MEEMFAFSRDEESEFFKDAGAFLPEGVLRSQGHDVDRVKENISPKDVREDPVLGKVYRINLLTTGHEGRRTVGRKRRASVCDAKPKALTRDKMLAIEDGDAEHDEEHDKEEHGSTTEDDSSSSSSSSSSSDEKKKKKKSKKDKNSKKHKKEKKSKKEAKAESAAETRAKVALAKAREGEANKAAASTVKNAETILAKLSSLMENLDALLSKPESSLVADVIRGPVSRALENFQNITGQARKAIKTAGREGVLPDVKDVSAEVGTAKKAAALLSTVLATMAKASSSSSR